MCSWEICSNCVMLWCPHEQKCLRNVSSTSLNLCYEELKQLWRQTLVQPSTKKKCTQKSEWMYLCISSLPSVVCELETVHPGLPLGTQHLSFSVPHKYAPPQLDQDYSWRHLPRPVKTQTNYLVCSQFLVLIKLTKIFKKTTTTEWKHVTLLVRTLFCSNP